VLVEIEMGRDRRSRPRPANFSALLFAMNRHRRVLHNRCCFIIVLAEILPGVIFIIIRR
jgi:hypothetical protein